MLPVDLKGSPAPIHTHVGRRLERYERPIDKNNPLFKQPLTEENSEGVIKELFQYYQIATEPASAIAQFIEHTKDQKQLDLAINALINYAENANLPKKEKAKFCSEMVELTKLALSYFKEERSIEGNSLVPVVCKVGARVNFSKEICETMKHIANIKEMIEMVTLYDIQHQTENSFFRENNFASFLSVSAISNLPEMQEFFSKLENEVKDLLTGKISNHGSEMAINRSSLKTKFPNKTSGEIDQIIEKNKANFDLFCKNLVNFITGNNFPKEMQEILNIRTRIIKDQHFQNVNDRVFEGVVDILNLKLLSPALVQLFLKEDFLTPLKRSVIRSASTVIVDASKNEQIAAFIAKHC